MKFLKDFCVFQLIPSLDVSTEGKFVFNTHIYCSQEFLFTFYLHSPFKPDKSNASDGGQCACNNCSLQSGGLGRIGIHMRANFEQAHKLR